jgi:hypothetical protein
MLVIGFRKDFGTHFSPYNMTSNQKLNKVLEFLSSEPTKINMTPQFVQRYIFGDLISIDEAQLITRKILDSGYVRKIDGRYPAFSFDTQLFLDNGGFGGEYVLAQVDSDLNEIQKKEGYDNEVKPAEVFVSYAWGDLDHEQKVLEFTNFLREKGFNAEMDKMISQRETTINFTKMMYTAMQYDKVVVVLSTNYKIKADSFEGGVGAEYALLINDIQENPKKYILVSFDGFSEHIIPFGLKGNEIVDLSKADGDEKLFRKLMGQEKFIFSPVSSDKPQFNSESINSFNGSEPASLISIEMPLVKIDGTSSQGGQYSQIDYKLNFMFKNISSKSIDGFAYEAKIIQQLTPEKYGQRMSDGHYVIDETISQKIFPNKVLKGETIDIRFNSHAKHQILGTKVIVTVFTDHGEHSKEFKVEELFKAHPAGQNWGDLQALTHHMFK